MTSAIATGGIGSVWSGIAQELPRTLAFAPWYSPTDASPFALTRLGQQISDAGVIGAGLLTAKFGAARGGALGTVLAVAGLAYVTTGIKSIVGHRLETPPQQPRT